MKYNHSIINTYILETGAKEKAVCKPAAFFFWINSVYVFHVQNLGVLNLQER